MPRDLGKFIPPDLVDAHCTECGAHVPDEFGSCDELFMSMFVARVHAWAGDVWAAYSSQHEIVRDWIRRAIER